MIRGVCAKCAPYADCAHSALPAHLGTSPMNSRPDVQNLHHVHFEHVQKSATERKDIVLVL
jgi:hypothetical protein